MQTVTLSNGKRVGNFSSPHPFIFEDGTVLPACSDYQADKLKVDFIEKEYEGGDIELDFRLSTEVKFEMLRWQNDYKLGKVDVVFCPLPMMTALKSSGYGIMKSPFRSIRMVDRIKKLVSITKQCI